MGQDPAGPDSNAPTARPEINWRALFFCSQEFRLLHSPFARLAFPKSRPRLFLGAGRWRIVVHAGVEGETLWENGQDDSGDNTSS
jgi:hypothetical protein